LFDLYKKSVLNLFEITKKNERIFFTIDIP